MTPFRLTIGFLGALLISIVGCHFGPQIENLETARRPEGVKVTVYLAGGESKGSPPQGELLDVRRESVLVNIWREPDSGYASPRLVTKIDNRFIDHVDAGSFGRMDPDGRTAEADRARLRRVSRFPQGLAPDLLEELLNAQGQESLAILSE
jgi:hypothetical protein